MIKPIIMMPGVSAENLWTHRPVFRDGRYQCWPNGGFLNASKSRDPFSGGPINILGAGLFMGQNSTNYGWQPSFVGKLSSAVATGDTTMTVAVAQAVEIVRRIGSTGTLVMIGGTTANGTVVVRTVTYSAVNQETGVITVTATGTNEVQTVNIGGTISGGTFKIGISLSTGHYVWTDTIAHDATFANVITNINTALDNVLGSGKVVASGSAYTAIALAFSGSGYSATDQPVVNIDTAALTGATTVAIANTTAGVSGAFPAGTLIGQNDGSYVPRSLIEPGYGFGPVADDTQTPTQMPFPKIPMEGLIEWSNVLPTVSDLGIRTWIKQQLDAQGGVDFKFSDAMLSA